MLSDLVLVHRTSPTPECLLPDSANMPGQEWLVWNTCLRTVFLSRRAVADVKTLPGDEVYAEMDAYRFLLEVLCGLHSRVLGENEIVSQFKKRFFSEALPSAHAEDFHRLAQALLADMKNIRRRHPLNLGSHSYGSYCRKESEGDSHVSILGAGELALALLPWFARKNEVCVHYRSEHSRLALEEKVRETHPAIRDILRFSPMASLGSGVERAGVLIVAAPMAAREIESLVHSAEVRPSRIIDLRGNCAEDPIVSELPILDLQDFFLEAEESNRAAGKARAAALARVAELAGIRVEAESIQIRTQGWEDLCG